MQIDEAELAYLRRVAKKALRRRVRAVRGALPYETCVERSRSIVSQLMELPELEPAKRILLYAPMRREVRMLALAESLSARGVQLALPRVDYEVGLMLHRFTPGDELVEGGYGIKEPAPDAEVVDPSELDAVVVPGLAYDLRGHRIGYGRGHYDQLLAKSKALRIAPAFDFQLVPEVPNEPHDLAMNIIVTESTVYRPSEVAAMT